MKDIITIVNYNNKTIYLNDKGLINHYKVIECLMDSVNDERMEDDITLTNDDFIEYQSKFTVRGKSFNEIMENYNVRILKYNKKLNKIIYK